MRELKYRVKQGILVAVFFSIIFGVPLIWLVIGQYFEGENYENRNTAQKPILTWDNVSTFPVKYESYYNDNLPFRNQLIQMNSAIEYYLFHNASNDQVIVGKDNWLFYNKISDGDPIACYKGTNLFTDDELNVIKNNLLQSEQYLKSKNIEFVLFIAPNKERIYHEKMPDYYGEPAENYAALQLINYLENETEIKIIYPYKELMEAKKQFSEFNLYYPLDTHWNYIGGYIGSSTLMKELGIDMPSLNEVSVTKEGHSVCDLADMINMRSMLNTEEDFRISGYKYSNVQPEKSEFLGEVIYHNPEADSRKLFVYRDSFATVMMQYIGVQFSESYLVHYQSFDQAQIDEREPDIFVYEVAERRLPSLIDFVLR